MKTYNNYVYISKSEFWDYYLSSEHAVKLLQYDVPYDERAGLFNEYVANFNIETSAYCNRKCSYCPVSVKGTRRQKFMNNELFFEMLSQLKAMDYQGIFTLSWFNEPLADHDIVNRVKKVKEYCPKSYIRFNSNGDYLTKDYLDELIDVGLNEILITLQFGNGEKYSDEAAEEKLKDYFDKLTLPFAISRKLEQHNISCDLNYRNSRILIVTNNWEIDGNDRGGVLGELSIQNRQTPCCNPFREFYVDVDGNVRYCCNLYIDTKPIGNVNQESILDIFFAKSMVCIRRNLLQYGDKIKPCDSCSTYDNANQLSNVQRNGLIMLVKNEETQ